MNCIIVEDQPPAQRVLKKYIEDVGSLELKGVFSDAIQAMEFLEAEPVDLLFLDVHLPKISGIDFLKTMANPPSIILTTAFSEYALESYEFNVVDYLLKPFSFQRFVKAISKVSERKKMGLPIKYETDSTSLRKEIYIKSGYEHIKIHVDDILHITADSDYTQIATKNKKHLSSESLRFWSEMLPGKLFYRIHKSHIVNIEAIEKIVGNQIYLFGGIKLPIGRAYKEKFMKSILK
ncbi:response regulator transcription factor [Allomuricauda sp. d1]|uniref:LytR/AlgR family response regulator transcription factor n=1 Tax=Allomuricauda sp. d1 TaxID=3136725 RepID=UPI0031D183EB